MALDPSVTDGACHGFRGHKPVYPGGIAHTLCFDEQKHQKGIALPLTHRPHVAQPSLPPLSRFLPLTRLSNSWTKSTKHALCFVDKHSSVLTDIMSRVSSSFGAIPDGHPGSRGRFLSVKRLLIDVAVRAGSGELARFGWGSWPTPGESKVTAESELTDDI